MKINPIQNQNFKGLKVKKDALDYLSRSTDKQRAALLRAGETMKDYKYTDLFVTNDGLKIYDRVNNKTYCDRQGFNVRLSFPNVQYPRLQNVNYFSVDFPSNDPADTETTSLLLTFEDYDTMVANYNKILNKKGVNRMVAITKTLEKIRASESKREKGLEFVIEDPQIADLMNKYGE